APLPSAAANASADMPNARAKVAKRFIRVEPTGQEQYAPEARPDRSFGDVLVSRSGRTGLPLTVPREHATMLTRSRLEGRKLLPIPPIYCPVCAFVKAIVTPLPARRSPGRSVRSV